MQFQAYKDASGNLERFSSNDIRKILDLLDGYMAYPYTIHEIYIDDIYDKNKRIDVRVRYVDLENRLMEQKLLILNDEVIDGETFHKRYKEWY